MNVTRKCIYLQTWYSDRNDHTTMTAPLTVLSKKLSIVGHCLYYNWGKHWNPECYYFGFLKRQLTWIYNGALLHIIGLGFRDKHRSSALTTGERGK